MTKLSVILCSWRSSQLLASCIDSIRQAQSVDTDILVTLNEGLVESEEVLRARNIDFVSLRTNRGTLAVDYVSTMIRGEYVVNINDDMLFHKGWDTDLISIIEQNYPCSASTHLVEPFGTGNPIVVVDNLGDFYKAQATFSERQAQGKYETKSVINYGHPIMVKTDDYFKVGGYSDFYDFNWFPGYGLDDWWAYRLYALHDWKFKCITSGKSCVYHGISMTNNKLSPAIKARNGREYFRQKTGLTIEQFRHKISCFNTI